MADTTTLESLTRLLPPEHRKRFSTIVARLRDLPDDDEHFQMLDGLGLIALLMNSLPAEIARIVEQAEGKLGETETEQLRSEIVAVLTDSLDTPSYKDLREAMLAMRDHEARFRQKVDGLHERLSESTQATGRGRSLAPPIFGSILSGTIGATLVVAITMFGIPLVAPPKPIPIPEKLKPYAALLQKGQLDYFETELGEGDERDHVGMYMIGGSVREAFRDGDYGVVVLPLKSQQPGRPIPD